MFLLSGDDKRRWRIVGIAEIINHFLGPIVLHATMVYIIIVFYGDN